LNNSSAKQSPKDSALAQTTRDTMQSKPLAQAPGVTKEYVDSVAQVLKQAFADSLKAQAAIGSSVQAASTISDSISNKKSDQTVKAKNNKKNTGNPRIKSTNNQSKNIASNKLLHGYHNETSSLVASTTAPHYGYHGDEK
jgi:hypothetical protein